MKDTRKLAEALQKVLTDGGYLLPDHKDGNVHARIIEQVLKEETGCISVHDRQKRINRVCGRAIQALSRKSVHPQVKESIISELLSLSTPPQEDSTEVDQCKHVKRPGESCTLNDNCKYPNCPK